MGGASPDTPGRGSRRGANGLSIGASSSSANGLKAVGFDAAANGLNASALRSGANGLAAVVAAAGGLGSGDRSSHEARAAFEPRSAFSQ